MLTEIRHNSTHNEALKSLVAMWKSDAPAVEKIAALRIASEICLGIFCYGILNYQDIDNEFLDEFVGKVEEDRDKDLFLLPRGHLKSSLFTVGGSLWSIIQNPERRIGIG